jgi:hypothetical protein
MPDNAETNQRGWIVSTAHDWRGDGAVLVCIRCGSRDRGSRCIPHHESATSGYLPE